MRTNAQWNANAARAPHAGSARAGGGGCLLRHLDPTVVQPPLPFRCAQGIECVPKGQSLPEVIASLFSRFKSLQIEFNGRGVVYRMYISVFCLFLMRISRWRSRLPSISVNTNPLPPSLSLTHTHIHTYARAHTLTQWILTRACTHTLIISYMKLTRTFYYLRLVT